MVASLSRSACIAEKAQIRLGEPRDANFESNDKNINLNLQRTEAEKLRGDFLNNNLLIIQENQVITIVTYSKRIGSNY
jgi:hypothetical protein